MIVMTAKVSKKRVLLIGVLLLAAIVLFLCMRGAKTGTQTPADGGTGDTNEARVAFLAGFGWEVDETPVQTQQVRVPEDPGEVFLRYNELQKSQGYDLMQYSGQTLSRYVYRITNYPAEGTYYATLLVRDGAVVGADVSSSAKDGVMHGLRQNRP